MMKRSMGMKIALAVSLAALAVIMGCSRDKGESGGTAQASGGGEAASASAADSLSTIRLVTDVTGIDDKSFNAAAWRGILEYYGDTWEKQTNRGKGYDIVTCQTQDMYIPNLKQTSDEGYDIIAATGFTFTGAITEVAPLYPDQNYIIIDVAGINQPNVMEFLFKEEQGSYLVGMAAALQAQADGVTNPRFGFIGGIPGAVLTRFEMGYVQGILSIIPDAQIVDYYANDWGKPELAKAQAKNWFDTGVYAIFSSAGATGNGTIAQAKEYRSQGKNVWAIGVDSDQYEDGIYDGTKSAVLTSMVKKVEAASMMALKSVKDGTFKGGTVFLDLAQGGVGYSTANPELKPEVVEKLKAAEKDIISGAISIIPTYKEAVAAGKAPAALGAKDD